MMSAARPPTGESQREPEPETERRGWGVGAGAIQQFFNRSVFVIFTMGANFWETIHPSPSPHYPTRTASTFFFFFWVVSSPHHAVLTALLWSTFLFSFPYTLTATLPLPKLFVTLDKGSIAVAFKVERYSMLLFPS